MNAYILIEKSELFSHKTTTIGIVFCDSILECHAIASGKGIEYDDIKIIPMEHGYHYIDSFTEELL